MTTASRYRRPRRSSFCWPAVATPRCHEPSWTGAHTPDEFNRRDPRAGLSMRRINTRDRPSRRPRPQNFGRRKPVGPWPPNRYWRTGGVSPGKQAAADPGSGWGGAPPTLAHASTRSPPQTPRLWFHRPSCSIGARLPPEAAGPRRWRQSGLQRTRAWPVAGDR